LKFIKVCFDGIINHMKRLQSKQKRFYPYFVSTGLISITTLFGEFVKKNLEPTNIIMFYLLIVVFVAIKWGRGPAIATSIISVLAFDFFLVPPYLTFSVADIQYLFTFVAFLVVGITMSAFASKVREQVIQRQTEKLHSALLSSISHDLKTPLVSITGALTTLLDSKSNLSEEHKKELLETAREESDRLNHIVNNILDMTKVEADVLRICKKPCDLSDLIGACLEQLKDKIGCRNIKINIPKDMPEVAVDFPFMLKAIYNIIENALKYSPPDKPVEIRASFAQGKVKIQIQDYGIGIFGDDIKRIFEKFYRVERAENVSGTGLGLCISKGIIEAHNGKITAESALGKGSVFNIEIPLE
jgi:two-component system, OmpR family, sensor histidine kinase KdpD